MYLSATTAIGCASEKALLLLIEAYISFLPSDKERDSFVKRTNGKQIKTQFEEFWKSFGGHKGEFDKELTDGIDIVVGGIFELLRQRLKMYKKCLFFCLKNSNKNFSYDFYSKYKGVLNKFIGDAVLVIFGDPIYDKDHALNAVKCAKDEYFIADLMGLTIQNEDGEDIGVLREVMETGANDVYIIDLNDGRELLLPAIKQCVLEVDVEAGFMKIHIMEGLLDEA